MRCKTLYIRLINLFTVVSGLKPLHRLRLRRVCIVCLLFFIYICTRYWYLFYHLLPEERGWLPKMDQKNETLQCKPLLRAAWRILDGEGIPLPFRNGTTTLWSFKTRVSTSYLLKNLNYGNMNESSAETQQKVTHYNIQSRDIYVKKVFITFGHNCCLYSKQRALRQAKTIGGFEYVHSFNMDSLAFRFRKTHNNVLRDRRGAGYWLWKPYILLKTLLENMAEGDMVMYQDAGAYIIKSVTPLLKLCQESKHGVIVFSLDKTEQDYSKKDALILMDMNVPEAAETFQRLASYVVIRKSCSSIQFVMEWLAYLSDRRIASNDENTMGAGNVKSFKAHRHDQTVMSLLSKKWGIPALRDPSQYGQKSTPNYYASGPYEQLVMHDRFKH